MSKKGSGKNQKQSEKTLNSLSSENKYSYVGFAVLLILYIAASVVVNIASRAGAPISIGDAQIPAQSFAGVFTSLANFCLIILVLLYKKPGFIVALVILIFQFPMLFSGMIMGHNLALIPGLFTNIFAIAMVVLIHWNGIRTERFQNRIREQAITSRLTGLPNRFACSELMDSLVARDEKFTVISVDLNNFKSINDTMGQSTGDQVLIEVAKRLKNAADSGQTSTKDFVTHQGGDEFAIIMRDYQSEAEIEQGIEFYESVLEKQMTVDECDYVVTASFGYAEYPTDADNSDTLFSYADAAMHEVKRTDASRRILRFTSDLLENERSLEVERKLRSALDTNSLYFNLQPQFDISQNLRGFEALARMKDDDGSPISPGEFIPVAEKVGLVDKIDACVFRNSAHFLGRLIKETGTTVTLSVNVSVKHLMKNDFIDEVKEILESSGVPANQLEIEITESIMIDSADRALQCINEIKELGLKVAIDDFGTGYSSLSYLNSFPADMLKVDKSFIDNMNSSTSSKQYVAAIISIGHIMHFDVISEGVEESEQLDTLRSIGCDYIQGFIWGRPMAPDEAAKLIREYAYAK